MGWTDLSSLYAQAQLKCEDVTWSQLCEALTGQTVGGNPNPFTAGAVQVGRAASTMSPNEGPMTIVNEVISRMNSFRIRLKGDLYATNPAGKDRTSLLKALENLLGITPLFFTAIFGLRCLFFQKGNFSGLFRVLKAKPLFNRGLKNTTHNLNP